MSIHGVLGENTHYPTTYSPDILYPISRQLGRDEIYQATNFTGVYQGVDIWQAFEVSWLDDNGVSQVALARFFIDASSPNIVESKSLKLYLNSLNFTVFASQEDVQKTLEKDLSKCIGADISVELLSLICDEFMIKSPKGECIDTVLNDGSKVLLTQDIDSTPLNHPMIGTFTRHQLYSNLLRSNCPVTNQPDWGTLQIDMTTDKIVDKAKLLTYILSFRQHNGFHEQCVERIFADLMLYFTPASLLVQANYTRRGGIDINPVRVFNRQIPTLGRLIRQ